MNILAVDTATSGMAVSVFLNNGNFFTKTHDNMRDQAQLIIPFIVDVLKESKLKFEDVNYLVSAIGPGSFTGIRVGLAAMQGISLASKIPLLGFDNFDIYAYEQKSKIGYDLLVALESHRSEVFFQIYNEDGNKQGEAFQTAVDELSDFLAEGSRFLVAGDAIEAINKMTIDSCFYIEKSDTDINSKSKKNSSENMALMLMDLLKESSFEALEKEYPAMPLYIRPPDVTIPKKA